MDICRSVAARIAFSISSAFVETVSSEFGPVAAVVVGAFAVFHGVAHGHELSGEIGAAAAVAGMVLATMLLHIAGIATGWVLRRRSTLLPRMAGAAVALFGVALLAQVA